MSRRLARIGYHFRPRFGLSPSISPAFLEMPQVESVRFFSCLPVGSGWSQPSVVQDGLTLVV